MENCVLFAPAPVMPPPQFFGVSVQRLGHLPRQQLRAASGSRVTITALTPRTPDPKKAKKKGRKKELEQWQKMIDRDLNDDRRGIGFWPVGSSVRTDLEKRAHAARTKRQNDLLTKRFEHLNIDTVLQGGPLDFLLYTLRARYLERMRAEDVEKKQTPLTEDIEALYALAIEEIRKCDALYYADDPSPRVPDREYDELVMHLLELERVYPSLIRDDSPSQIVGHSAAKNAATLHDIGEAEGDVVRAAEIIWRPKTRNFAQVQHLTQMLSLANAYSQQDLASFSKKLDHSGSKVAVEMKIDGIALSLHFEDRKFALAATRGNGRIGDDVTDNVRAGLFGRGIPDELPPSAPDGLVIVRGEVFISPDDFKAVQKLSDTKLSNARNAAAGALKQKDPAEVRARRPQFVAYECLAQKAHPTVGNSFQSVWPTQGETLMHLPEWGFGAMPKFAIFDTVAEVEAFAAEMEIARSGLPFEADGVVLKVDDAEKRFALGNTAKAPRGAIALKFTARSVLTTVNAVRMQVSRTGAITPVAELAPVILGGATISRATLHNFDEVRRLGVAVGDTVLLERGGDVIPKIANVQMHGKRRVPITAPKECPCCGSPVRVEKPDGGSTTAKCTEPAACAGQKLGRLLHFVSRDGMDIAGFGVKTASKLLDSGLVVRMADVFKLSVEDILGIVGFQEKSSRALHAAIETSATERTLERLIFALGVPGIGRASARSLAINAVTIDGLRNLTRSGDPTLLNMPNVAEKSAERIAEYLGTVRLQAELAELVKTLQLSGIVDEPDVDDGDSADEVKTVVDGIEILGKLFAITGTLHSMPRAEAVKRIKAAGGKISATVTRKTDYLISGVDPGVKYHKAQRLGVRTMFEEDLAGLFKGSNDAESNFTKEGKNLPLEEQEVARPKLLENEEIQRILKASDVTEDDDANRVDAAIGGESGSSARNKRARAEPREMSLGQSLLESMEALGDVESAADIKAKLRRATPSKTRLERQKKGFKATNLSKSQLEMEKYDKKFEGDLVWPTGEELDRELGVLLKDPEVLAHLAELEKRYPVD